MSEDDISGIQVPIQIFNKLTNSETNNKIKKNMVIVTNAAADNSQR